MKIGVIGAGKMGKEIIKLFLSYGCELAIVCHKESESILNMLVKDLGRQKKRGLLTEEEYDKRVATLKVGTDCEILKDCEVVIETITENMERKHELLERVQKVVSSETLIVSNTSSLELEEVFAGIEYQERCAGFHFFYPVKLSGFIEINCIKSTSEKTTRMLQTIAQKVEKKTVVLCGQYNLYINHALGAYLYLAFRACEKYQISVKQMNQFFEAEDAVFGPFELVDGIGLGLLSKSDASAVERMRVCAIDAGSYFKKAIDAGCEMEPGCFTAFMETQESDLNQNVDAQLVVREIMVPFMNECLKAKTECGVQADGLIQAVWEVVGLGKPFTQYYEQYGYEGIVQTLATAHSEGSFYEVMDKEHYEAHVNAL